MRLACLWIVCGLWASATPSWGVMPDPATPLLAVRRHEEGFRGIYTIQPDGTQPRFLVAAPGYISSATPEWSPDGQRLAFDALPEIDQTAASHIFVHHVAGPHAGQTLDLGCGNVPTWSPQGDYLAFMLNGGNPLHAEPGIWMMHADGSNRVRVARGQYPRWSPDGEWLCIYDPYQNPSCFQLHQVATGRNVQLLGQEWSVEFGGGTWTADGQIVFIGSYQGKQHVALCDRRGEAAVTILYTHPLGDRTLVGPPVAAPQAKLPGAGQVIFAMQTHGAAGLTHRSWLRTYLYSLRLDGRSDRALPQLLEGKEIGLINRGMMWSRDGQLLTFSSERPAIPDPPLP